jgi:hypothetical protein
MRDSRGRACADAQAVAGAKKYVNKFSDGRLALAVLGRASLGGVVEVRDLAQRPTTRPLVKSRRHERYDFE